MKPKTTKLLSTLLTLAMLLSLLATGAPAALATGGDTTPEQKEGKIVNNHGGTYTDVVKAFAEAGNGDVLKIIDGDIDWKDKTVVVEGKTVTLDTNGKMLTITCGSTTSGTDALQVKKRNNIPGKLILAEDADGQLNLSSTSKCVNVEEGCEATVTNLYAKDHNGSLRSCHLAYCDGGTLTVRGYIRTTIKQDWPIEAKNGAKVTVQGRVQGDNYIKIDGYNVPLTSTGDSYTDKLGYYQYTKPDSNKNTYVWINERPILNVPPNFEVPDKGSTFYYDRAVRAAPSGGTIRVLKDYVSSFYVSPVFNKSVTIDLQYNKLDITAIGLNSDITNYYLLGIGMEVTNSATVTITNGDRFNVTGREYGLVVRAGSKATVSNVTATGYSGRYSNNKLVQTGVWALGGEATIEGDVRASSGVGVHVTGGGKVTVEGTITAAAASYVRLGETNKTKDSGVRSTKKPGYLEYTDGTNTVWVRDPADPHWSFVGVTDIYGVPDSCLAGEALDFSYNLTPPGATNRNVMWTVKSAGTTQAKVVSSSEGKASFLFAQPGTAVMTATIKNGATTTTDFKKDFTIVVVENKNLAKSAKVISVNGKTEMPGPGSTLQMALELDPPGAEPHEVVWSVDSITGTANIDSTGLLTATTEGDVVVTAIVKNSSGGQGFFAQGLIITIGDELDEDEDDDDADDDDDDDDDLPPINLGKYDVWALPELTRALELNLIPRKFDGLDLTQVMTRVEFAAVCVALYEKLSGNKAQVPETNPFTDTDDEDALKAKSVGIMEGVSDTEFGPDTPLNRQTCATALTRVFKKVFIAGWTLQTDKNYAFIHASPPAFEDDDQIADWAVGSVYFMVYYEVLQGTGNNRFSPQNNAKRQEGIVIDLRIIDKLSDGAAANQIIPIS